MYSALVAATQTFATSLFTVVLRKFASSFPLKLDSQFKMLFLVLCLIPFSRFSVARGELQAVCSSGMTVLENQTASPGVIKITGTLPYNRNLQRSCVLKMDTPESCLHVKAKRNGNSQGKISNQFMLLSFIKQCKIASERSNQSKSGFIYGLWISERLGLSNREVEATTPSHNRNALSATT